MLTLDSVKVAYQTSLQTLQAREDEAFQKMCARVQLYANRAQKNCTIEDLPTIEAFAPYAKRFTAMGFHVVVGVRASGPNERTASMTVSGWAD